jgi:DNA-binding transcriptional MerR regulator
MENILIREFNQILSRPAREEFSEIYDSLTEFRFTIADIPEISSRVLSYWAKEGVLLEDFRDHKWRRFDLVSFLWLKTISQLRDFNIPLSTIRNLTKDLKGVDDWDSIMRSPEIEKVIIELGRQDGQEITDVKLLLDRPDVRESVKRALPSFFMTLVLDTVIVRDHLSLLVNREGAFLPYKESFRKAYNKIPEVKSFLRGSYISISISGLLQEFLEGQEPNFLASELRLITAKEAEVLNAINQPGLTAIQIQYKNGEMDRIEITKKMKVDPSKRLYEIMLQEGYQDIEIKVQDKTIVCCHNTYKKKFDDLGTG